MLRLFKINTRMMYFKMATISIERKIELSQETYEKFKKNKLKFLTNNINSIII